MQSTLLALLLTHSLAPATLNTPLGAATALASATSPAAAGVPSDECAPSLVDQGDPLNCIEASSVPTLGKLMPLSRIFSINGPNVGINTEYPTAPLDIVLGDKRLKIWRDGNLVPGIALSGLGGNLGVLRLRNALEIWPDEASLSAGRLDVRDTTGAPLCALDGGSGNAFFLGNVGVGTTSPGDRLDVAGGINVDYHDQNTGTLSNALRLGGAGTGEGIASNRGFGANTYGLDFYTDNLVRMSITLGGDVGIGRLPASNTLEIEGSASKTSAGSWLANSDRRIKTQVRTIDNALETLERVRPVAFHYTADYLAQHPKLVDQDYYNVIAQEFAEVFPEYVRDSGEDGILQVDTYPALIHAIAAVKELHAIVNAQAQQVSTLEQRLAQLEHAVASLSSAASER